jgi:DNA-directed RNA polymerase subunit RPC12/RpoP
MKCAEILVEHEPVTDLTARSPKKGKRCELEEEENRAFYRCPACGAKNLVAETRNSHGFPELRIIAYSFE